MMARMAKTLVLKKSYGVAIEGNDGAPLTVLPKGTPKAEIEAMGEFVMSQLCDDHFTEQES